MSDDDDFDFELVAAPAPKPRKATRAERFPVPQVDDDTKHKACWPVQEDRRNAVQGKEHGFSNNTKETPFLECTLCRNIELDSICRYLESDSPNLGSIDWPLKNVAELLRGLEHRRK